MQGKATRAVAYAEKVGTFICSNNILGSGFFWSEDKVKEVRLSCCPTDAFCWRRLRTPRNSNPAVLAFATARAFKNVRNVGIRPQHQECDSEFQVCQEAGDET